jgi:virulence factor Mce-like protein
MHPLLAGTLVIACAVFAWWYAFSGFDPFKQAFVLKAAFSSSTLLREGAPVRIAGIEVGKVKHIQRLGASNALVTMDLEPNGLPVHADASAKLRPRIFLEGNEFVDLQPGSPAAPALKSGDTIPISQTAVAVSIGQYLQLFTHDTRADVRTILRQLGAAYDGAGGRGFNRSIPYWQPALRDASVASDATRGRFDRDLSSFIASAGIVAAALDKDPQALRGTVRGLAGTSEALAADTPALQSIVAQLDATLVQGRRGFVALDSAFPPVRRLVAALRPAIRSAGPALDAALPLVRQLRALVSPPELLGLTRDMRPLVPKLVDLTTGGLGLQEQARLLSNCQLQTVIPTLDSRVPDTLHPGSGPVYEEAAKGLTGFAGGSRSFDANGRYTKSLVQTANFAYPVGKDRFFFTTSPLQGVNPPPQAMPPFAPTVPCETQQPPDLNTIPAAPPTPIKVNHSTPAYLKESQIGLAKTVSWLRQLIRRQGLDGQLRVTRESLTRGQLGLLRQAGH